MKIDLLFQHFKEDKNNDFKAFAIYSIKTKKVWKYDISRFASKCKKLDGPGLKGEKNKLGDISDYAPVFGIGSFSGFMRLCQNNVSNNLIWAHRLGTIAITYNDVKYIALLTVSWFLLYTELESCLPSNAEVAFSVARLSDNGIDSCCSIRRFRCFEKVN